MLLVNSAIQLRRVTHGASDVSSSSFDRANVAPDWATLSHGLSATPAQGHLTG